jgi:hypothetical protein
MTGSIRCVTVLVLAAATARAAPSPPAPSPPAPSPPPSSPPPRILVLPLPPATGLDPNVARTFDARLLVALDDTRRVVTATPADEPDCVTTSCLAELGAAAGAALVLSLSAVREDDGVTLFGTVVDAATKTAVRRVELDRVTELALAKQAPAALVPQIVGAPPGPPVLGVAPRGAGGAGGTDAARTAALAMTDQLAAMRAFKVLPLDGTDRSTLTHTAELTVRELTIDRRRHVLCTWFEGTLVGTFAITELATGRVVFTRTVTATARRRAHFSSRAEITDLLVAQAVGDWMAAFREARRARPAGAPARAAGYGR